jgi:hypothetical protein
MPALANYLVSSLLNSVGTTTDAAIANDKTFNPAGINAQGVTRWEDRAGGIPVGFPHITLQLRPPTQASRIYKTTVKLILPTLEQTSPSTSTGIQPAPTKAYDCSVVMEFMIPERSTTAERQALMSQLESLLVGTIQASDGTPSVSTGNFVRNAVVFLEPPY